MWLLPQIAGCLAVAALLIGSSAGADEKSEATSQCNLLDLEPDSKNEDPIWLPCRCEVHSDLRAIESADPLEDLAKALSRGDRRVVGVMEYSMLFPGIDWSVSQKLGFREIRGGGDVIRCYEFARLMALAREYARVYNTELSRRLSLEP